jgi:hypothetical protein
MDDPAFENRAMRLEIEEARKMSEYQLSLIGELRAALAMANRHLAEAHLPQIVPTESPRPAILLGVDRGVGEDRTALAPFPDAGSLLTVGLREEIMAGDRLVEYQVDGERRVRRALGWEPHTHVALQAPTGGADPSPDGAVPGVPWTVLARPAAAGRTRNTAVKWTGAADNWKKIHALIWDPSVFENPVASYFQEGGDIKAPSVNIILYDDAKLRLEIGQWLVLRDGRLSVADKCPEDFNSSGG